MSKRRILGAAIGDCVHVGGVVRFLHLAAQRGFEIRCLGPAVSVESLIAEVAEWEPDIVAVGYRLTPESGRAVLEHLKAAAILTNQDERRWILGATDPVAEAGRELDFFEAVFGSSTDPQALIDFLDGGSVAPRSSSRGRLPRTLTPVLATYDPPWSQRP